MSRLLVVPVTGVNPALRVSDGLFTSLAEVRRCLEVTRISVPPTEGSEMQISQTLAYAVHAVLLLEKAEPGTPVSCPQLALTGGMPERYLLQILRSLVNSGILESVRGVDGGYLLARSVNKISLLDLSDALREPIVARAKLKSELPLESRKPFQNALDRIARAARRESARISVSELIPSFSKKRTRNRTRS